MLRDAIGQNGSAQFRGCGDLSLTELLPALLTRYSETEMMIVAPSLPDQAADIVGRWMRQQWAMRTGTGKLNVISRLTIVADLSEGKSPTASGWLSENPFGDRLSLVDRAQDDTALLLPDIAVLPPKKVIGANTVDAMRSGAVFGTAALIDGMLERMEAELGYPCTAVATGGLAREVIPCCKRRDIVVDPDLLLKGLWILYTKNR